MLTRTRNLVDQSLIMLSVFFSQIDTDHMISSREFSFCSYVYMMHVYKRWNLKDVSSLAYHNVKKNANLMSNTGSACAITWARGSWQSADNKPDQIGIWKCWFLRRGENRSTRRKTSGGKEEYRQQTQPTHICHRVRDSNPGHIGGRRALLSLHHPYSPIWSAFWKQNVQSLRDILNCCICLGGGYRHIWGI